MDAITLLRPDGLVRSPAFSHVAVIPPGSTTVLVGGQNAVDASGALVGGDDIAAQTTQVLTNLRTALAAGGATLGDVVHWRVDLVDGVDLQAGYAVIAAALDPDRDPPLVSAALVSRLAVPGALVELSVLAAVQR